MRGAELGSPTPEQPMHTSTVQHAHHSTQPRTLPKRTPRRRAPTPCLWLPPAIAFWPHAPAPLPVRAPPFQSTFGTGCQAYLGLRGTCARPCVCACVCERACMLLIFVCGQLCPDFKGRLGSLVHASSRDLHLNSGVHASCSTRKSCGAV